MSRLHATRRYIARFAVLVLLGLALALVTGAGPASAGSGTSISIAPKAYVYLQGVLVEAQVTIVCTGGLGNVSMQVTQTAAESSNGLGALGSQTFETANCDGSPHKLDVTLFVVGQFDIGTATADAQLITPSGSASDERTISIVSV